LIPLIAQAELNGASRIFAPSGFNRMLLAGVLFKGLLERGFGRGLLFRVSRIDPGTSVATHGVM
jgi:hypothetical protein